MAVRMGKKVPDMVIGTLHDDPAVEQKIAEFLNIEAVVISNEN